MIDDEHIPIEQLVMKRMRKRIEMILPNGIILYELSYDPRDRQKYRFILSTEDRKARHGVTFETPPTNRQIHLAVAECVSVISRKKRRDEEHDRARRASV